MAREKYFPTELLMLDNKSSQLESSTNKYKPPPPREMSRRPVKSYRDRKKTLPVEKQPHTKLGLVRNG